MNTLPTTLLEAHARIYELEATLEEQAHAIVIKDAEIARGHRDIEARDATINHLRRDGLTGLFRRDELWPHLAALIRRYLETAVAKRLVSGTTPESLTPEEIASLDFTFVWGDLSYLALANAFGHEVGDRVVARFGEVFREIFNPDRLATGLDDRHEEVLLLRHMGVRHGGDEFIVCLADTSMQESVELMEELAQRYKKSVIPRMPLPLRVDFGHCHMWEALEAFHYWVRARGMPRTERDRVTLLRRIMISIADNRSKHSKMVARIGLVVQILLKREPRLQELLPYITKGTHFPKRALADLVAAARGRTTEVGAVLDRLALDQDVRRAVDEVFDRSAEEMQRQLAASSPHNGEDIALSRLAVLATQGDLGRFLDGAVGIQTI